MSDASGEDKKIIIDEDWKGQVEREREELAQKQSATTDESPEPAPSESRQAPPPASLLTLISLLSTQALAALGAFGEVEGAPPRDPALAKHFIDLLGVVQEKTQGNVTPQEAELLEQSVHELRMAFVQSSTGGAPAP